MRQAVSLVITIFLFLLPIKEILCQSFITSNWYAELWGNSYYSVGKEFSKEPIGARIGLGLWPSFGDGGSATLSYAVPINIHSKINISNKSLLFGIGYSYVKSFYENENLSDISSNSFYIASMDYPLLKSKKGVLYIGLNYTHAHTNPMRYSVFPGFQIRYSFIKITQ